MNLSTDHSAFELLRSQAINSLNITVEEYRHRKTGAQHIHLASDSSENVFLVALRTVPQDSKGSAHILEHTVLCGSEKYPLRSPFFTMKRRSLNTFMNAITSADWTIYPFASQNKKDFNNLLDVYLDSVFFACLNPLDFSQEGHRVEFESPDDVGSDLVYRGVVFNEMKGALSSVTTQLWHSLCKYVYPSITYHHISGGHPRAIPSLSYEELQDFYRRHYHPSNAIFVTYGDIPAVEHQAKFEESVLQRFERSEIQISVPDEQRFSAPISREDSYPVSNDSGLANKTHIVVSWLLGNNTDLEACFKAQLLSSVLFDNSASPLRQVLETTNLGSGPSPQCGIDSRKHEMVFVCGVEGSEPERAQAVEDLILQTLEKLVCEGVPQQQVEASLHRFELNQREVRGGQFPYGLQLMLSGLSAAIHRGDIIGLLDLEPTLEKLRKDIQDPDFIKNLIRELLLDNSHRVRLTLRPDDSLSEQLQAEEVERLALMKAQMTEQEKQQVIDRSLALQARQQQKDDDSVLPKVGLSDIKRSMHYVDGEKAQLCDWPLSQYEAGTNGLVYQQIVVSLPHMSTEQSQLLPLYCRCLTALGIGEKDYLATQSWQMQAVGSISAFSNITGAVDDVQSLNASLTLSAKALSHNHAELCELMEQTLSEVRFDEYPRIRELVAQARSISERGVANNGHGLAVKAASSGFGAAAKLAHEQGGLAATKTIKVLDGALNDDVTLHNLAQKLQDLHQLILKAPRQFLLVGEKEHLAAYRAQLEQRWEAKEALVCSAEAFQVTPVDEIIKQAWLINTQVNFCSKAYATVPYSHPDTAALTVLGGFLGYGFLHREVREQGGAYGSGAAQNSSVGVFNFYSYRDPRLSETLDDFDHAIEWLQSTEHDSQALEEAIIGAVSAIDKPTSPADEATKTFHAELSGRSRERREQFRSSLLTVTVDDLKRVANTYLKPELASIAVVSSAKNEDSLKALGLEIINL